METLNLQEALKEFNLTDVEVKIVASLVNNGECQIGKLIKNTSLHRGTVYNVLQRLIQNGIIKCTKFDNNTSYSVNSSIFYGMIEEELSKIEKKKELIKTIEKCIKISNNICSNNLPKTYSIVGERAFKGIFFDILNSSNRREDEYKFLGNGGEMRDRLGGEYYRNSQKMKAIIGTKCKVLLNVGKKQHPFSQEVSGMIKWLEKDKDFGSVNVWICNDKTVIVDWNSKPLTTIVLESKNIANHYTQLWKTLWKNSSLNQQELNNLNS